MTSHSQAELITQIYDTASDWLIRHRTGTLDDAQRRLFDQWLRKSPEHIRAYLEMSSIWEDVSLLQPEANASAGDLIEKARAEGNVFPLEVSSLEPAQPLRSAWRHRFALAASLLIVIAGVTVWFLAQRGTYITAIGEQRTISLADGSSVELNSRTRVRIRYTERSRSVNLLAGQALFRVAKDAARPFTVESGPMSVRAIGTAFDVYKKRTGTVVTVVEGRVAILSSPPPQAGEGRVGASSTLISAGEQLTVTPSTRARPRAANLEIATAWTQQKLVFDYTPLADVADEFNRYNARQLVIADRELEQFHVSGIFSSADPSLLLRFLRAQPSIAIAEADGEVRISRR